MTRFSALPTILACAVFASPALGQPFSHKYSVLVEGKKLPVLAAYESSAHKLDRDRNRVLTLEEMSVSARKLPGSLRVDLDDFLVGMVHEFTGTRSRFVSGYPDVAQIEETLQGLAQAHPGLVTLVPLGPTPEGRQIIALRVSTGVGEERPKLAVVAQQHAREWMAHQVALASLKALLEDPANLDLLETFDFWFVPLANPDGYAYSRDFELMWRKNRGPSEGVDLNRNFAADFRRPADQPDEFDDDWGASDHPSSALFRGDQAGSEPETRYLQALLDMPGMAGVVDVHGFGCKVVLPNETMVDGQLYDAAAKSMIEAMGQDYEVLRYQELYPITGHLSAYADQRGAVGITLEVGGAFQPDPAKIAEVSATGTRGVLAFARAIADRKSSPPSPQP